MNERELLNELMKRYSFEKSHSIRQLSRQDGKFENDDVCVIAERTFDGYIFDCKWSLHDDLLEDLLMEQKEQM